MVAINSATASSAVKTSTATLLVALAWPASTSSRTSCAPTNKTTTATRPVAEAVVAPSTNQENWSGLLSMSCERDPSSTTRAFLLLDEMTRVAVALASATGGWSGGSTVMLMVAGAEFVLPSLTVNVKPSGPM